MSRQKLARRCPACKGSGKALVTWTAGRLALRPRKKVAMGKCPRCSGTGYI